MRGALLLFVAALSACNGPASAPEGERPHPTIVSLNPCSDAVLAEVAAPGQLLAISHYSQNPASSSMDLAVARRFRAVTGSAEEVLALHPDVVVADPFLAPATRTALERAGIIVETLPIARNVEESREQVLSLARLAGDENPGVLLNARIDAALARAAAPRVNTPIPAVVWQAGGIVPGRETLVADLLARTGFSLASASRGMGQADYLSLEELLADPPYVLFVAGDGRSQENRMLSHPALDALAGTRRAQFDASLLWCGGPTIVRAVERLAEVRKSL
ncbi:MAG: ABC transporter substrate-binding protein [Novosphingobium sp.]|nr:ABC transporter substrate-binding protein [Novosphingobium sp.]